MEGANAPSVLFLGFCLSNKIVENGWVLMSGLVGSKKLKCHPEFISGSCQNVVSTLSWQDAETSSA
ncbi:hypothetical protein IJZ97_00390 [bacterium]|nr:hypothetical protein [bacterium]